MSSNLNIKRICSYCGNEFQAKQVRSKYCSDRCGSQAYKARVRENKISKALKENRRKKNIDIEELKRREFLTVTQTAKLIGCSRQNIYKLIRTGKLKSTNILEKKTIIKRVDIEKLFEKPPVKYKIKVPEIIEVDINNCYSIDEVQKKHGISERALYDLIKRKNIPKAKIGWYTYVPKPAIDELFK